MADVPSNGQRCASSDNCHCNVQEPSCSDDLRQFWLFDSSYEYIVSASPAKSSIPAKRCSCNGKADLIFRNCGQEPDTNIKVKALTCISAAIAILSHFAGLKARKHTKATGDAPGAYNSSASVVNAIFLCFVLWLVSTLRATWPKITIPFLVCTIYSIVAISNGPGVASEHNSLVLCKQLLLCYLTGFGISIATSLLFFPKTSRSVFMVNSHRFLIQCRNLLQKQGNILGAIGVDVGAEEITEEKQASQISAMKTLAMSMLDSMSSLREELYYARTEVAFGFCTYDDLESLLHLLESLMIPLLGLSKISNFTTLSSPAGKRDQPLSKSISATVLCVEYITAELNVVLQHTELLIQSDAPFVMHITIPSDLDSYQKEREEKYQAALELARNHLASRLLDQDNDESLKELGQDSDVETPTKAEENLFLLCLLQSGSDAVRKLSSFVRSQLEQSVVRSRRLIVPPIPKISFLSKTEKRHFDSQRHTLDPEHLPPRNGVEKVGNVLREALSALGSDASKFGLRIVAATMSIGILAFLKSTQHFFVEYRLVWAMVMIPISMSPTAGTAIYGFIGRGLGVAAAMALAYINWYIVDGKTGGVVVFFFISMMIYYYLLLKYPRFIVLFILAAANHVLIIGKRHQ
jgi:hypothetical protein